MSLVTSTIETLHPAKPPSNFVTDASILAGLLLAAYAAKKSKKQFKKLKRKLVFAYLKESLRAKFNKVKGLFSKKRGTVSDRTLLYILLALLVLVLLFIEPIAALAILVLAILLILLIRGGFSI
jgi:hypothetical protein